MLEEQYISIPLRESRKNIFYSVLRIIHQLFNADVDWLDQTVDN